MPFAPKELIVKRLVAAHEAWYDVFTDYEFAGRTFDAYCEFHSHGEKYVLVKRAKLWEVNAHEYLFIDALDHLDAGTLDSYVEFMETRALEKVDPVPNHMQSSLSLVIVADRVDDEAKRACRKTRFRKNFALGNAGKNNKMFYVPMVFMLAVTLTSLCITIYQKVLAIAAGTASS